MAPASDGCDRKYNPDYPMSARSHRVLALGLVLLVILYSCARKTGSNQATGNSSQARVSGRQNTTEVADKYKFDRPKYIKGLYLTAWTAGGTKRLDQLIGIIDRTELNTVVIDIRDSGLMYWKTGLALAAQSGANHIAVTDPNKLFRKLEEHQIYPIARIACFRDNFVPHAMPERAVQIAHGRVWKDRSGHSWLDPYNKKNWMYLARTVDYAMSVGFQGIQLDYVRFPSEGKAATQVFPARKSYPNSKASPSDVIHDFCSYIRERVKKHGCEFSADIFGIISSTKGDEGIGQTLEKIAEPFDVISPMVYPSHFARGEYGIANPNSQPYAIIKKSLSDYKKRLPDKVVRPWLQDFTLGAPHYGPAQIQAQIKAMRDVGYEEFLLWNAGNRYTEAALDKEGPTVAKKRTEPATNAGELGL